MLLKNTNNGIRKSSINLGVLKKWKNIHRLTYSDKQFNKLMKRITTSYYQYIKLILDYYVFKKWGRLFGEAFFTNFKNYYFFKLKGKERINI